MSINSPPRTRFRAKKHTTVIDLTSSPSTKPAALVSSHSDITPELGGGIQPHPARLTPLHTKLPRAAHELLLRKQAHLQKYSISIPRDFRKHSKAVSATLVFAQEEAGTAVCVSPSGLLLTCAHCVAEDDEAPPPEALHWLLFASGPAVSARCVAWDEQRDLALLKIVAGQAGDTTSDAATNFPSVQVAEAGPALGDKLVCVGHPGSEDFEADEAGVETGYDVLHLSTGVFRGYAEGQDLQDNSDIGALQHDCWTYWGHSGAPLFDRRSGNLVGLHSSWDDETAMRRGIAWEAIVAFLGANRSPGSKQSQL